MQLCPSTTLYIRPCSSWLRKNWESYHVTTLEMYCICLTIVIEWIDMEWAICHIHWLPFVWCSVVKNWSRLWYHMVNKHILAIDLCWCIKDMFWITHFLERVINLFCFYILHQLLQWNNLMMRDRNAVQYLYSIQNIKVLCEAHQPYNRERYEVKKWPTFSEIGTCMLF